MEVIHVNGKQNGDLRRVRASKVAQGTDRFAENGTSGLQQVIGLSDHVTNGSLLADDVAEAVLSIGNVVHGGVDAVDDGADGVDAQPLHRHPRQASPLRATHIRDASDQILYSQSTKPHSGLCGPGHKMPQETPVKAARGSCAALLSPLKPQSSMEELSNDVVVSAHGNGSAAAGIRVPNDP